MSEPMVPSAVPTPGLPGEWLGPVDYLVVVLPGDGGGSEGVDGLLRLVDEHILVILDAEVVRLDAEGPVLLDVASGPIAGLDLSDLDGASSGLLDDADLATIAEGLDIGQVALAIVYEVIALDPLVAAFARGGAELLVAGPVTYDDLAEVLEVDAIEGDES